MIHIASLEELQVREIRVFKAVFILNRFENFYQCFEKNGLLWQLLGRCALVQL